jgi:VWFA-related protein
MRRALLALPILSFLLNGQLRIPDRPANSVFQGEQGKQKTEIRFDPATGTVELKLLVQDSAGYFIPNLHPDNFVVYESGVRKDNASVAIEHPAVSLALVLESGGRYPSLNKVLTEQVSSAGRQLLEAVGHEDRVAIWKYSDQPALLADFSTDHGKLQPQLFSLQPPGVSEANLFDAFIALLGRMTSVSGRRAIILVSSGLDTFSKAKLEDAVNAARSSDTPVYAISLGKVLQNAATLFGDDTPAARLDWKSSERNLGELARASGGRLYSPSISADLSPIYDDILENLKVRYVITYKSSTGGDLNVPRKVSVVLVDPKAGGPLQISDASGKAIQAHVVLEESYIPNKAAQTRP